MTKSFRLAGGAAMALVTALLAVAAFPPVGQASAAWFCLVPLLVGVKAGWSDWRHGWGAGVVFWLGTLWWIGHVTVVGMVLLCVYLGAYWGVWCGFIRLVMAPRAECTTGSNLEVAFAAATGWVGLEAVRGWLLSGFPWNGLGASQFENLGIIQIAKLGGGELVTWLVVFVNAVAALTIVRFSREVRRAQKMRPHFDFTVAIALVAGAFSWGIREMWSNPTGPVQRVRVGFVQGNIPQDDKADPGEAIRTLETYLNLTAFLAEGGGGRPGEPAAEGPPDLILWPETTTGTGIFQDKALTEGVRETVRTADFSFVMGSVDVENGEFYNAVFAFLPREGGYAVYRKQHLVPFGEYVPLREWMPWLGSLVAMPGDYRAGDGAGSVFEIPSASGPVDLGVLICFEDTLPYLARARAREGARLLVNLTNDGWFRESPGAWLHTVNAVLRCIETGLPMVRCANTGPSCIIEPTGRIPEIPLRDGKKVVGVSGAFARHVIVQADPAPTVYVRWGHVFPLCCLVLSACFATYESLRDNQRRRAAQPICAAQEVSLTSPPSAKG